MIVKKNAKVDIKLLLSCSILLDFSVLFQILFSFWACKLNSGTQKNGPLKTKVYVQDTTRNIVFLFFNT